MKAMISDLKPGNRVTSYFSVKFKKAPKEYKYGWMFEIRVADASGEMAAKYWGPPSQAEVQRAFESFSSGDVVKVSGEVREFGQGIEIGINPKNGDGLARMPEGEYDLQDLVGKSPVDKAAMLAELASIVATVKDRHLAQVLDAFFGKEGILEIFSTAPASMQMHSNYVGGLLEHSIKVARICDAMAGQYPAVDRDLLVAGALLHDIGKVREMETGTSIEISDEGMFRGHVVIGDEMVGGAVARISGFPPALRLKLSHMMLSHHGKKEWGSPKEPQTAEALLLHFGDMADSQVFQYLRARAEAKTDDDWAWDRRLGHIYLK
jgi:3'-5' exoribonuclease